ncbi:MAG: FAD:protein FMN transferase [Thermodesulfobacteriota bacterium]
MGTTYTVKIVHSNSDYDQPLVKSGIDEILKKINSSMSVYDKNSEISVFNRMDKNKSLKISADFMNVLAAGKRIHEITKGAWDASAGPLVNLWGFGSEKNRIKVPSEEEVKKRLKLTGFDKVILKPDKNEISKTKKDLFLDLGSIAKGYGVDKVSKYLLEKGFDNYMVEIGGEVYVSGKNLNNEKWKIGINSPKKNAKRYDFAEIIEITGKAVATSGTYRNFKKTEKGDYSHIIDPKSGYPVKNSVVSATVVSENCTFADGLATGILVMGTQKALKLCSDLEDTECMIIAKKNSGFYPQYSKGFKNICK